ncbi:hypothetical protein SprV_0301155500 [Sparganum proliferum]
MSSPSLQRHYEDFPKASSYQPGRLEDLTRDQPAWRRKVKTGAAIYQANRVTAIKAKRGARKSQMRPPLNANFRPPRPAHTVNALIGLIGHRRTICSTRTTPAALLSSSSASSSTPTTNIDRPPHPPLLSQHPVRRLLHPPPLHTPATPNHYTFIHPHHTTSSLIKASNWHLSRKWEVCISAPSPCDSSAACAIRVRDYHGASSTVAWKAADRRPNSAHAVCAVVCVSVWSEVADLWTEKQAETAPS